LYSLDSAVALQKFLFHIFSPFGGGVGGGADKKIRKFFVSAPRELASVGRGVTTNVERTERYKTTTSSARMTSFVLEAGSDLVQLKTPL